MEKENTSQGGTSFFPSDVEIESVLQGAELTEDEDDILSLLQAEETGSLIDNTAFFVRPSDFVERAIRLPIAGAIEHFSFEKRQYLLPIYNSSSRRMLFCWARQTEKSTSNGNISLAYAAMNVGFKVLYVTASSSQALVFSSDRIKDAIELSPILNRLQSSKLAQNVLFKQFFNRSQIRIRYAFHNADRVRGISSDCNIIDELQDVLVENIPIIEQCSSHSHWKISRYCGTPKSVDNTMAIYWGRHSTQNEWVVPCERHSPVHWNILDERNIGRFGLICDKCGQAISPSHKKAQWVSTNPRTQHNENRVVFDGYRIPQLMVPWVVENEESWRENILLAREQYDKSTFYNEVLALSCDSGDRPITKEQLKACCNPDIDMSQYETEAKKCDGDGVFVGIDWGTSESQSHTVLSLGAYFGGQYRCFYFHRFDGREAELPVMMDTIFRIIDSVNFRLIGADYGGGFDRNDALIRRYGPERVVKYQYVWRLKKKLSWEPSLGRFVVYRSEVMTDIFSALRRGRKVIELPNWNQLEDPYGSDILNIFSEFSTQLRMTQYKRSPDKPDDSFHSLLYQMLASLIIHPRSDILLPFGETQS